jgi:hypothetical protein
VRYAFIVLALREKPQATPESLEPKSFYSLLPITQQSLTGKTDFN